MRLKVEHFLSVTSLPVQESIMLFNFVCLLVLYMIYNVAMLYKTMECVCLRKNMSRKRKLKLSGKNIKNRTKL